MQDLLEQGAGWLAGMFQRHAARPVSYCRGVEAVTLRATIGKTEFQKVDASGVVISFTSRDYLIAAADLLLGGVRAVPAAGDRITETAADGTAEVYEVLDLGSERAWRWSDPYKIRYRIHTKAVDEES